MKIRRESNFISFFNEITGEYLRTGIIQNGRDTGEDPFMTSFPELLDVGIMGHCKHGASGLCVKAGIGCYQDGLHSDKSNMTIEDFRSIAMQCKNRTFQFALGGCGDPDQHEHFQEILKICRENGIVPNFTTSGLGMNRETAEICKKYCGAVAVSWYRSRYTYNAVNTLVKAGVKTNIHYVLSKSTVEEAYQRLCGVYRADTEELSGGFPEGINAVVFLLHKPVGLGSDSDVIETGNEYFGRLTDLIDKKSFPFKIGFDSCSVPALLSTKNTDLNSLDTCEGARWSAYISADMKMMPCSFDNQAERWAVDLKSKTISEAWESNEFENFRNYFRRSCPECSMRKHCMGGCPIVPEIVVCRVNSGHNTELMKECSALADYAVVVEKVRKHSQVTDNLKKAIDMAIKKMPKDSEVGEILKNNRSEVANVLLEEYTQEYVEELHQYELNEEKKRADAAETRADAAEKESEEYKKQIEQLRAELAEARAGK